MSAHTHESEKPTGTPTKQPKPPLGPPHDTIAALALTATGAALIYVFGFFYATESTGWMTWATLFGTVLAFLLTGHYFSRAYGFPSRAWGRVPIGARLATTIGYVYVIMFAAPPVYEAYAEESTLVLVLTCFAIPTLVVGTLRGALGKAPRPSAPTQQP